MAPLRALRMRYVPLLLIYFAYGSSVFVGIAGSFWVKKELSLSAEDLLALSVWLTVPWTIKMIFGQLVDSVTIFGSNRKVYVLIGAILMTLSTLLLIGIVGEHTWVAGYSKESIYIFASVLGVVGFVMQDVVADTMTTEVVDKSQSDTEIQKELATIQVLSRLSLGLAIFIMGWLGGELADIYGYETVYKLSLFIPILSVTGVLFVKLNPVMATALNKQVLFGGLLFAVFVVLIGYNDVPYSQEIVFVVSLGVVLYLLSTLIEDLDPDTIKHIKMAMIVIFVYRAMPSVGPALQWWEIDVLKFDESFFAKLSMIGGGIALAGMWFAAKFIIGRSIGKVLIFLTVIGSILSLPILAMYYDIHTMLGLDARTVALVDTALASPFDYIASVLMLTLVAIYAPEGKKGTWFALMASLMNIALSAGGIFSKYLNKIFVLTREIKENGVVTTPANYDDLGLLLWIVIGLGFIIPIVTIWIFNPDPVTKK
ncbi:MAG: Folate carrier, cyanobacterial type [uncultured Sulfurovum sp.]|uniref:Folate carrier, cyanobacterial type n=1 Tax=uncultured Sulfurovum sp. TaxID=269237 RepID=A0A6S6SR92_9BACT|nr:MAG: Folate carrier, cyanobacterial type [uncultured Sulfurovum sp.]